MTQSKQQMIPEWASGSGLGHKEEKKMAKGSQALPGECCKGLCACIFLSPKGQMMASHGSAAAGFNLGRKRRCSTSWKQQASRKYLLVIRVTRGQAGELGSQEGK